MKRTSIVFIVALAACGSKQPSSGSDSKKTADGLVAFETVRSVLQHPRCQNCHPRGDVPLQGDDGHPHLQNVQRGPDGQGMVGERCSTCHGPANPPDSYGKSIPPGTPTGWRMPKPDERLVFVGVAPGALCEQIKDPKRNGGKDMAALRHHLDDPLVTWGWNPGFGRAPIPVAREAFLAAWQTWADAGTPCPPQ